MRCTSPVTAVLALTLVLTACDSAGTERETGATAITETDSTSEVTADEDFTIGLALIGVFGQVVTFIEGFKEALADAGLVEGENVTFVEHNAQNDQAVVPLMARQIVNEDPDLIMSFGTPVIIALAQETESIPIVFGAMADPMASGVVEDVEAPGTNLTGTSSLLDAALMLELVSQTLPDAEVVGIILNPGQQNSAAQLDAFEAETPSFGIKLVTAPVSSTGDLVVAATSLEGRVDAVILPQDNTVGEAYETVADTLIQAGLPIFAASDVRAEQGLALVGVGFDVWQLGFMTGVQAAQILLEGADPAEMPVIFANSPTGGGLRIVINLGMAELLDVEVPNSVLEIAQVYEETPYGH